MNVRSREFGLVGQWCLWLVAFCVSGALGWAEEPVKELRRQVDSEGSDAPFVAEDRAPCMSRLLASFPLPVPGKARADEGVSLAEEAAELSAEERRRGVQVGKRPLRWERTLTVSVGTDDHWRTRLDLEGELIPNKVFLGFSASVGKGRWGWWCDD